MFSLYSVYFYKRLRDPSQNTIPCTKKMDMKVEELVFWVVSNTLLTMLTAYYVLFYSRVYEEFSMFVRICIAVIKDLVNFTIFLVFWIILFVQL